MELKKTIPCKISSGFDGKNFNSGVKIDVRELAVDKSGGAKAESGKSTDYGKAKIQKFTKIQKYTKIFQMVQ